MISLALYIRDRQEKDRRHELQIPEAIRGSDGIQLSYVFTKDAKVRTVRESARLADLQGTLCVSGQYRYTTTLSKMWKFY